MEHLEQKKRKKKAKVGNHLPVKTSGPKCPAASQCWGKGGTQEGGGKRENSGFALEQDPPALSHLLQAGEPQAGAGRQAGKPQDLPFKHPTHFLTPLLEAEVPSGAQAPP